MSEWADSQGNALPNLPEGGYHFRADQYGLPFWSGAVNHCEVPGCQEAVISTYAYGNDARQEQEIVYTYDALNRLTAADYSPETYMHYTYDGVGNRLSQEVATRGEAVTTTYAYDDANRLVQAGAQAYTWDNNGNLLNDGQRQYSYDAAYHLTALTDAEHDYAYAYNGLGDRVSQSVDGATETYQLDLNAGLTQVVSDGVHTYLYGNGRIAQDAEEGMHYFLPDGLGSVRTVLGGEEIALVRDYMPYGEELASSGSGVSAYGFAGEWTDASGMQYLRARYYNPSVGRFVSRDSWSGYLTKPLSLNKWNYVEGNPINYTDPSGMIKQGTEEKSAKNIYQRLKTFSIEINKDWGEIYYYDRDPKIPLSCGWNEGRWKIRELELIEQAANDLNTSLNGKLAKIAGNVIVNKMPFHMGAVAPPGALSFLLGDVVFLEDISSTREDWYKFSFVHEFGHVWDYRSNNELSKGLMETLGTWICPIGPHSSCYWDPYHQMAGPGLGQTIYPEPPPDTPSGLSNMNHGIEVF